MLERKGLLLRETSEEDRRVTLIRLTPTGRERVRAFRVELAGLVSEMLSDIDAEEQARFLETLKKLNGARPDEDRDAR